MEEDPKLRDEALAANNGEGTGMKWRLFIALVRRIWMTAEIPRQLHWIIVVLLPKGGGGYRGIGLMEPIWKVVEGIMDQRLNVIEFHDCLHGYLPERGTGTAIMEAKLAQQLAYLEQHPLYVVFIDLKKAFDAMDRNTCLLLLRDYGVGPNMLWFIMQFWNQAELACRANGNFGRVFFAERG